MAIVYASNGLMSESRQYVTNYLDSKLEENPTYCIVDIGGGANPWYANTQCVVDIIPVGTRETICGDLNDPLTWEKVRNVRPDFIICTHLLEDVRDPFYIMTEILGSAKAGYISMPTKHQEFSRQESIFYVGYCHHRWVYTLQGDILKVISKMPIVNYWASAFSAFRKLCSISYFQKQLDIRGGFWPAMPDLPWLDTTKGREPRELGFIWETSFSWKCINNDFAGNNYKYLANLYMYELRDGL